ncbi:hypothetical protein HK105_205708 [Polyrhizophydium stewartii]|uniref:CS domain-containing protein n=1 Tax=Polyrhizophydium stewartii TaxID=2732419 RepID=A0ABR4N5H4_9FUNG
MMSGDEELTAAQREELDREARAKEKAEQDALPYRWRQTLQDVDVTLPLPKGVRGKDLVVVFKQKYIKIALKSNAAEPLLEGELCNNIKIEDSTWLIDGGELLIHLEKVNKAEWWKNVVTHHPAIDTTKIVPENSKLDDLDGETRAMVEKMMYDQRQKAMGLPTSDDQQKMRVLERFKEQHPEMDFSNAKIA